MKIFTKKNIALLIIIMIAVWGGTQGVPMLLGMIGKKG